MRLIINLLLIALIGVLVYVLVDSIREPINFKAEKDRRKDAVVDKLMEIRQAQEMYRGITGEFAHSFDTLKQVLTEGQFELVSVTGDADDPNFKGKIQYSSTFVAAIDSVRTLGMNLDALSTIPLSNGQKFDIKADTLTYQSTLVNVVEVGTSYKTFMGEYGDPRFARYDNSYDPNKYIKFGDMNKPNLSGNWER